MSTLPSEFKLLDIHLGSVPAEVHPAFQYGLAQLLIELDRLSEAAHDGGDVVHFCTPDGVEFSLPNPRLPEAQTDMVKEHVRWLLSSQGVL